MKKIIILGWLMCAGSLVVIPSVAHAEHTMYGFSGGAGFVGGFVPTISTTSSNYSGLQLQLVLPAFEIRMFRRFRQSLDIQLMLGNLVFGVIAGAINRGLLLPLQVGLYYNFRFGGRMLRFVVAPGAQIDLSIIALGGFLFGLSVAPGVRLGLEIAVGRSFAFEIRARPFVIGGFAAGNGVFPVVGGGLIGEVAFYFG